nr:4586_t:CDS:2 [Entrophospora candida]
MHNFTYFKVLGIVRTTIIRMLKAFRKIWVEELLKRVRSQITDGTPEFCAELMKRCRDHNSENSPAAKEIYNCFGEYYYSSKRKKKDC